MVKFTPAAATAVLAFVSSVAASPVSNAVPREEEQVVHPIGYDDSVVSIASVGEVPEQVEWDIDTLDTGNSTIAEAFTPAGVDDVEELSRRFITGVDDRVHSDPSNYPWSVVGRLLWSNGVYCSAALVGPRHILTAKHCLISGQSGTFAAGYDSGSSHGTGQAVTSISVSSSNMANGCETKLDFGVIILNERLGDQLGYFGAKLPEASKLGQPIMWTAGYPGDKGGNRQFRQGGITNLKTSLSCDQYGPIYSDADVAGGQSGSPLWELVNGARYIWGALSIGVTSSQSTFSGWASGDNMVTVIVNARANYP